MELSSFKVFLNASAKTDEATETAQTTKIDKSVKDKTAKDRVRKEDKINIRANPEKRANHKNSPLPKTSVLHYWKSEEQI